MEQSNLKLLSILEKMANPISRVDVTIECEGIFGFPEEWIKLDEQNPFMGYKFSFMGFEKVGGKIVLRKPTEEELKQIEEEKAAKTKKIPAGRKGPEIPQLSAEEIEKQKKIEMEKAEKERLLQMQWDALSPEEQNWRTLENIHKKPAIKFEEAAPAQAPKQDDQPQLKTKTTNSINLQASKGSNNSKDIEKTDKNLVDSLKDFKEIEEEVVLPPNTILKEAEELVILEEKVTAGGDYIIVYRYPNMAEDEVIKLKKKSKAPLLNDLNPLCARAWVDLKKLQVPGATEVVVRCQLEQMLTGDATIDSNTYDLKNTYIKLKISTKPAIFPLVSEPPKIDSLIPKQPAILKLTDSIRAVNDFRQELKGSILNVAEEYVEFLRISEEKTYTGEDMPGRETSKKGSYFTNQQKHEDQIKKRNEFVKDFHEKGKIELVKDKLRKSISLIVKDKFQKQGPLLGVTLDKQDQFFSDLYEFFIRELKSCMNELVVNYKNLLHEDIVASHEYSLQEREKIIKEITKETPSQTLIRLSEEYDVIGQTIYSEKKLQNLLDLNRLDPIAYYQHCLYNLQTKQYEKAESSLMKAISFDVTNTDYQTLLVAFHLRRGRTKEALIFLKNLLAKDQFSSFHNILMSFLYNNFLNEPKLARKYFAVSQRVLMRKLGLLPSKDLKVQPMAFENAKPQLTMDQNDSLWYSLIDYFLKHGFYELVEKINSSIYDKSSNTYKKVLASVATLRGNHDDSINIYNELLSLNPKDSEIIYLKALCCFKKDNLFDTEELFFQALKLNSKYRSFSNFLRIGYIFLKRKAWMDAKCVLIHACQLNYKSPLAWLGLGIACMRIGHNKEALEALTQANIFDPYNHEIWGYLVLLCLKDERMVQANQSLREMLKLDNHNFSLLEEIGEELIEVGKLDEAELCFRKIETAMKNEESMNMAKIFWNLGKIMMRKGKYTEARDCFENGEALAESEVEKKEIQAMKKLAEKAQNEEQKIYIF